jgi:hypothetical protein
MALRLGQIAVDKLIEGQSDKAVGLYCGRVVAVDLETAVRKKEFEIDQMYNLIKVLT